MKQNNLEIGFASQNERSKESEVTTERIVAFLDIMGFKDRVMRHSHREVLKDLEGLTKNISDNLPSDESITYVMFSDSIVLFANEKTIKTMQILSEIVQKIISYSVKNNIPIKGSMACGTISLVTKSQLFFGQPLIDAYLLEESLKCYGVVVHNTLDNLIESSKELSKMFALKKTPIEKQKISHYYLLSPEIVESDFEALRKLVSGEPRGYIDRTIELLKE